MQNAVRPAACPFGSHRSIDPEGTLPHLAWKLDTSLPIFENELLIRMKTLNINAAFLSCGWMPTTIPLSWFKKSAALFPCGAKCKIPSQALAVLCPVL